MDWLEDDEMMRQWEEVSKEEEKITVSKMEGRNLRVKEVQKAPELLASQVSTKEQAPQKEKEKVRWLVGPQRTRRRQNARRSFKIRK